MTLLLHYSEIDCSCVNSTSSPPCNPAPKASTPNSNRRAVACLPAFGSRIRPWIQCFIYVPIPAMIDLTTLARWLVAPAEHEHLEFKEAKQQYDTTKLLRYCVALANEGGGYMVLGVSDKPPRRVVGSQAFAALTDLNKIKAYMPLALAVWWTLCTQRLRRIALWSRPCAKRSRCFPSRRCVN